MVEPRDASAYLLSSIRRAPEGATTPPKSCQAKEAEEKGGGDQGPGVGAGQAGHLAERDAQ